MSDYQSYNPPPAALAPNSSMAIISLVASILGFTLLPIIGSIIAVITAPMAKREIQESGGTLRGEGMAQAGLIIGWAGIGLTVVGICIGGAFIVIPLCIALFASTADGMSLVLAPWLFL
jgi:hypothetical protein